MITEQEKEHTDIEYYTLNMGKIIDAVLYPDPENKHIINKFRDDLTDISMLYRDVAQEVLRLYLMFDYDSLSLFRKMYEGGYEYTTVTRGSKGKYYYVTKKYNYLFELIGKDESDDAAVRYHHTYIDHKRGRSNEIILVIKPNTLDDIILHIINKHGNNWKAMPLYNRLFQITNVKDKVYILNKIFTTCFVKRLQMYQQKASQTNDEKVHESYIDLIKHGNTSFIYNNTTDTIHNNYSTEKNNILGYRTFVDHSMAIYFKSYYDILTSMLANEGITKINDEERAYMESISYPKILEYEVLPEQLFLKLT